MKDIISRLNQDIVKRYREFTKDTDEIFEAEIQNDIVIYTGTPNIEEALKKHTVAELARIIENALSEQLADFGR